MPVYYTDDRKQKIKIEFKSLNDLNVFLNEKFVSSVPGDELKKGVTLNPDPATEIYIEVKKKGLIARLTDVKLNGILLVGSASHPETILKPAFNNLLIFGVLYIIMGLRWYVSANTQSGLAISIVGGAFGVIFIILAMVFKSTHSVIPFVIATVLVALQLIAMLFPHAMAGSADIPLFYTIANIICLVSFFKFIKGINDFKAYRTQSGLN